MHFLIVPIFGRIENDFGEIGADFAREDDGRELRGWMRIWAGRLRRPVGANNYSPLQSLFAPTIIIRPHNHHSPLRFGHRMYVAAVETVHAPSLQMPRDLLGL